MTIRASGRRSAKHQGLLRLPLLAAAIFSLTWGVWMGLLRLGWILPLPWPEQLILHGPLMIGGFLGTLVGLERAIGIARRWAYLAPVFSATGALLMIFGPPARTGPVLFLLASAIVVVVFLIVMWQQPSMFAATMLAGAVFWFVGNVVWTTGPVLYRIVFWWVAFVVLTIAGERLELNRLLRPTRAARLAFVVAVALLAVGVVGIAVERREGAWLLGAGLLSIAAWLARNDLARRTVRQQGLTRYIAVCLLSSYVWLAVAGVLIFLPVSTSSGPTYDAVLHAIFVGFVVSMIFGHAPIVIPAVLGAPLKYNAVFYLPLVVLHASVAMRLTGDLVEELGRLRAWGALGNAVALALFIVLTAFAVWRQNGGIREE